MKKKIIAVLVLALLVSTVSVFALGIGIQGGGVYSAGTKDIGGNAAITFKVDQSPLVFAVDWFANNERVILGLTGYYWILNSYLAGPFNYFVGLGFGATVGLGDPLILAGSVRAPIGVNAFFADGLIEPYLQVVPQFQLAILPEDASNGIVFGANAGIRFWF